MTDFFMKRTATYSPCNTLRFTLSREWSADNPNSVFYIGHNPSKAGHEIDDPTSLAWVHFAKAQNFGRYVAGNLYPYRSSDPKKCREWANWEKHGPDWWARDRINQNLRVVAAEAKKANIVVACWGAIAYDTDYVDMVIEEIQAGEEPWPNLYCLGKTISGAPKHPLARGKYRVSRDQCFELWRAA